MPLFGEKEEWDSMREQISMFSQALIATRGEIKCLQSEFANLRHNMIVPEIVNNHDHLLENWTAKQNARHEEAQSELRRLQTDVVAAATKVENTSARVQTLFLTLDGIFYERRKDREAMESMSKRVDCLAHQCDDVVVALRRSSPENTDGRTQQYVADELRPSFTAIQEVREQLQVDVSNEATLGASHVAEQISVFSQALIATRAEIKCLQSEFANLREHMMNPEIVDKQNQLLENWAVKQNARQEEAQSELRRLQTDVVAAATKVENTSTKVQTLFLTLDRISYERTKDKEAMESMVKHLAQQCDDVVVALGRSSPENTDGRMQQYVADELRPIFTAIKELREQLQVEVSNRAALGASHVAEAERGLKALRRALEQEMAAMREEIHCEITTSAQQSTIARTMDERLQVVVEDMKALLEAAKQEFLQCDKAAATVTKIEGDERKELEDVNTSSLGDVEASLEEVKIVLEDVKTSLEERDWRLRQEHANADAKIRLDVEAWFDDRLRLGLQSECDARKALWDDLSAKISSIRALFEEIRSRNNFCPEQQTQERNVLSHKIVLLDERVSTLTSAFDERMKVREDMGSALSESIISLQTRMLDLDHAIASEKSVLEADIHADEANTNADALTKVATQCADLRSFGVVNAEALMRVQAECADIKQMVWKQDSAIEDAVLEFHAESADIRNLLEREVAIRVKAVCHVHDSMQSQSQECNKFARQLPEQLKSLSEALGSEVRAHQDEALKRFEKRFIDIEQDLLEERRKRAIECSDLSGELKQHISSLNSEMQRELMEVRSVTAEECRKHANLISDVSGQMSVLSKKFDESGEGNLTSPISLCRQELSNLKHEIEHRLQDLQNSFDANDNHGSLQLMRPPTTCECASLFKALESQCTFLRSCLDIEANSREKLHGQCNELRIRLELETCDRAESVQQLSQDLQTMRLLIVGSKALVDEVVTSEAPPAVLASKESNAIQRKDIGNTQNHSIENLELTFTAIRHEFAQEVQRREAALFSVMEALRLETHARIAQDNEIRCEVLSMLEAGKGPNSEDILDMARRAWKEESARLWSAIDIHARAMQTGAFACMSATPKRKLAMTSSTTTSVCSVHMHPPTRSARTPSPMRSLPGSMLVRSPGPSATCSSLEVQSPSIPPPIVRTPSVPGVVPQKVVENSRVLFPSPSEPLGYTTQAH